MLSSLFVLSLAASAIAAPSPRVLAPRAGWDEVETTAQDWSSLGDFVAPSHWAAGGTSNFTADSSCNATQKRLIGEGLAEAMTLLRHARAHLRRFGNDTTFVDWFGAEADSNQALGLYDRLVEGDKTNLTFTCTDVSNLCNGTYGVIPGYFVPTDKDTTVVCPTYYLAKPELQNTCAGGETLVVGGSELTRGSWFVHRLLHSPTASGGRLSDVVDTVAEALELAAGVNASQAITSIHTVQYFALDTYATDILVPGVGCRGDPKLVKRDLARYPIQPTY
ncbi:putative peptidase domain-containing protein [Leucosporidium creatinivorum]|uniref:Putative peptidase domain-containing protein n=1 Tax=Leucosporidium creatinivorum TaxID=106004 RepID=A0A1Y2DZN3_9BASI|nr:putative peptidase domain-containing protein [Leucosporidium creatinivorum]